MASFILRFMTFHSGLLLWAMIALHSNAISGRAKTYTSHTDSDWTEWLHYIVMTSTTEGFDDVKSISPSLQFRFTDASCLATSTVITRNTSVVEAQHIFVASNGSGNFTTLQAAIDSIPKHNQIPTLICIAAGKYREKVIIPKTKDLITLIGDSSGNGTVIVWNDTAATINPETDHPLRTFYSPTVAVNAEFFVARNVIFENDAPPPERGEVGGQAVALRITGDYAAFYNCKFLGHQDTLYDQKGRHYFKNCFIQGSVDFIFGNGRSLYKECYVRALDPGYESVGSVTAQKRGATKFDSGFAFLQCNLTGDNNVYLGRAWGKNSRVVFAYTWMDDIVVPQGWNNWGVPGRERTVFYAEFECSGPGANNSTRVPWARQLTTQEAQPFLSIAFVNGETWLREM
ncbi:hypothetical protein GOP47_0028456 [Adiantum capillus-veneris]|nr:hypothetical protein GOP47_0028456 [Adiantum capillus-veneris]